ncbi:MAG: acyl carrier protein [Deltaproteobacteria bacterium]|jgi:acyl carrier protein|nr:acyl carrier protein [Deltaproteobacteria bacterium]
MSDDILERVQKLVAKQLTREVSEVLPESSFQDDLSADSLDISELMMSLEDEFGIKIDDESMQSIKTVKEAVDFISDRINSSENAVGSSED